MSNTPAMTIAVEFEVRAENTSTGQWLETWGVRAADAFEHEPKTTAYEAAIATDDAKRVLVFERYEGGNATLTEHMNRPAHEALMEKMGSARMTRRRCWMAMGYEVEDFGWRFSGAAENGLKSDGFIIEITAIRCSDLTGVIGACQRHADVSLADDTGMLLYGLSMVSVEDQKDFDLREGDLILSRAYLNHEARAIDQTSDLWKSVCERLEQLGGKTLFSRAYVSTGSGFVWKGKSHLH